MNLAELRQYVRTQTQTLPGELPDTTIDPYLMEGFNRTVAYENQWPWYEQTWTLVQPTGSDRLQLPGDVNTSGIVGLLDQSGNRIDIRSQSTAEEAWTGVSTVAGDRYVEASIWAREINLWPNKTAGQDIVYTLTGFRFPSDWMTGGPAAEPDIDPRLHRPLAHYAIALAYAQQEDDTLEQQYMQRWQRDVEQVRSAIMEPAQDRPLVMGPKFVTPVGRGGGSGFPSSIAIVTGPGEVGPPGPQGPPGQGGSGYSFVVESPPTATAEGQTWFQSSTGYSYVWIDDGNSLQWVQFAPGGGGTGGGFTFMRETAPMATAPAQTWFQTTTGRSFVWLHDGSSFQWVQFAGPM